MGSVMRRGVDEHGVVDCRQACVRMDRAGWKASARDICEYESEVAAMIVRGERKVDPRLYAAVRAEMERRARVAGVRAERRVA